MPRKLLDKGSKRILAKLRKSLAYQKAKQDAERALQPHLDACDRMKRITAKDLSVQVK